VLIPALGLPGTITAAGLLNLLIAIAALKLAAGASERPAAPVAMPEGRFGQARWLDAGRRKARRGQVFHADGRAAHRGGEQQYDRCRSRAAPRGSSLDRRRIVHL